MLVYLWPALVGGKILSPLSILFQFPPWRQLAPADLNGYLNTTLTDVAMADYPWRWFARELIHEGTLPAWNPHVFAGAPFFSNPQTGLFSPFSVPLWILPFNYAIGVAAALKLWVGGLGTYLLVRQLRLGFLPGVLAGIAFAFSALNIVWLTHETLPAVAVMLPWIVWFVERIVARGRLGDALGLALATAAALGGGHPGMQVHLMGAVALYVLLRAALAHELGRSGRLRLLALAGGGLALGTLLMAVMLVPELRSSEGTLGTVARQAESASLPGSHVPFDAIKTVVFPDWWGRPSAIEVDVTSRASAGGVMNYNERTFYAGAVALLLACVGLLAGGAWRRKAPFVVLGVVGLAVPLHAPVLYPLVQHLPGFELVQNQRLHFVFAFAVAVLAAFGLHAVLERPRGELRRLAVPLAALLVGIVVLVSTKTRPGDAGRVLDHFLTGADSRRAAVVALTSVVWFLLFALGVGLALLAARRWPRLRHAIALAVVLLAALDALHFAHGYQPMAPASKAIPPVTPAIAYLRERAGEGRFTGLDYTLLNDWSLLYGLHDIRGYDPPQPTLRFYRLWRVANPAQSNWQTFGLEGLDTAALNVISVLGARHVITDPGVAALPRNSPLARWLRPVYEGPDATILANAKAPPRALLAPAVELTANEEATLAAIAGARFDPRRTAIVERDQPGVAGLATGPPARGGVAVTDERNARVTLRATLDRRGLVVLNDSFADGWSVRVDGRDAQAIRVNDVMRGVVVGAGRHEVVWSYAVPGLRLGLALSLLALALLLGGALTLARRARRLTRRPTA